jgi:broad specificity phosphatase PhoE
MKTVYLVRHGQARVNVGGSKYYEGETSPLTDVGEQQACYIAERTSKLPVELLIASTALRSQQTAEIISRRILKPVTSSNLFIERRDPTSFIGRIWDYPETQLLFSQWQQTWFSEDNRFLDGENFADMRTRAIEALRFLEIREESNIIVVTHGFFLRVILSVVLLGEYVTGREFAKITDTTRTQNTGITVLQFSTDDLHHTNRILDPRWVLYVYNDHAHLG